MQETKSDVELVVELASKLEKALRLHFGAQGRGLGELSRSVENRLPQTLRFAIQQIAHQRNRVVHDGISLRSRKAFATKCAAIERDILDLAAGLLTLVDETTSESAEWFMQDPFPQPKEEPEINTSAISRVWWEAELYNRGVFVHCAAQVVGYRNVHLRTCAYVYDESMTPIVNTGGPAASVVLCPPFDDAEYEDINVFVPWGVLSLAEGDNHLYLQMALWDGRHRQFVTQSASCPIVIKNTQPLLMLYYL